MEGDVSSASSCVPLAKLMEYSLVHDPFDISCPSPLPLLSTAAATSSEAEAEGPLVDACDVSIMGNLLTDMLSSDFLYGSSNRYLAPDTSQNFTAASVATDQASKLSLLQMLGASNSHTAAAATSSSYSVHLKLPVLEEARDQQKAAAVAASSSAMFAPPTSHGHHQVEQPQQVKPEVVDPAVLLHNAQAEQLPVVLDTRESVKGTPATELQHQASAAVATTASTNSDENSSDNKLFGVSQSSSGTETQQTRPKRKRVKACKNSEEVESQRQTHIAVERNRRKQMNEHLNVLRSLMPGSYVQKGDQASIIGGAIEFVKELEQLLQCLQAQKRRRMYSEVFSPKPSPSTVTSMLQQQPACPFPPPPPPPPPPSLPYSPDSTKFVNDNFYDPIKELLAEAKSPVADIEVRLTGSDAVVKILSQRRPGQLLKTISALEAMSLSVVHTNITTIEQTVLYSFTVKLGLECRLSVEEIAESIQQVFGAIHSNHSSSSCSPAS